MSLFSFKRGALAFSLILGVSLLGVYGGFRILYANWHWPLVFMSLLLLLAELHTLFHLSGMFYCLWPRKYSTYSHLSTPTHYSVNIFICVCGEPIDVIKNTLEKALVAARYYNHHVQPKILAQVIVLNDGKIAHKDNYAEVSRLCKTLGVREVCRSGGGRFKAGNINNGLSVIKINDPTQAIDCILDADMAPKLNFLTEILKPFNNSAIDFVQTPQRYRNQENNWVAQAASAHQIFFFNYICPAKAHDNALFLCGTNFAIRRSSLMDIGGMNDSFITEDYATSVMLHASHKNGVFMKEVLAIGMAPQNLKEYFNQQRRWSKGSFDTTWKFLNVLLFGPLSKKQKFHYLLSASYYLVGIRDLLYILAPLPFLFFGTPLVSSQFSWYIPLLYIPFLTYNTLLYVFLFRHPVKSAVLDLIAFPVFAKTFIDSLLKVRLPFVVTLKQYKREPWLKHYWIQLSVALLLSIGLYYSLRNTDLGSSGTALNYFWAFYNVILIFLGLGLLLREQYVVQQTHFQKSLRNMFQDFRIFFLPFPRVSSTAIIISFISTAFIIFQLWYIAPRIQANWVSTSNKIFNTKIAIKIPEFGAYYGYHRPEFNSQNPDHEISSASGKPALALFYEDWDTSSLVNADYLIALHEQSIIPIMTWEPWDYSVTQPKPIASNKILAGEYDAYIRSTALQIKRTAFPVVIRYAHEMNGDWYPWGDIDPGSAERYVAVWRYIHNIFTEADVSNVIWLFAPNHTTSFGELGRIDDFYPGDAYVDWVGFSAFNWGDTNQQTKWSSFKYLSWNIYSKLLTYQKPIIVAETSSVSMGGKKYNWFYETLKQDLPSMPGIKGVIFFDSNFQNVKFELDDGMNMEAFHAMLDDTPYFNNDPQYYAKNK